MAIRSFLAMTAAEIRGCSDFPSKIAWMASHFSPYCTGLSNLPRTLPPGSLLILDDITPIHGHDPEAITVQLQERMGALECAGLLLDFQRPGSEETAALVKFLADTLPFPVGVSDLYAEGVDCPVFLPPVPLDMALPEYAESWQGQEVWLEMAPGGEIITLTEQGVNVTPLSFGEPLEGGFAEEKLHCHYQANVTEDKVTFTLWRTREDLDTLLEEAAELGITTAVGLYQEFRTCKNVGRGHDPAGQ